MIVETQLKWQCVTKLLPLSISEWSFKYVNLGLLGNKNAHFVWTFMLYIKNGACEGSRNPNISLGS